MSEPSVAPSKSISAGALLLTLALILVVGGTVGYLATHDTSMHTWRRVGDLDAAACLVLLSGLLFPLATIAVCRVEGLKDPRVADHFRQSSLLYVLVVLGALALLRNRDAQGSLGYAIGATSVVGAFLGIVANSLTLTARGRRARVTG